MPAHTPHAPEEARKLRQTRRTDNLHSLQAGRLKAILVGGRTLAPADSLHALVAGEAA